MKQQGTTVKTTNRSSSAGAPGNHVQRQGKISSEEIRRRAYEIYLQRQTTGRPGSPEADWEEAERQLRAR